MTYYPHLLCPFDTAIRVYPRKKNAIMGERNAIHSIVALLLHLLLLEVDVAAAANCGSKPLYFPAGSFPLPNSFPITLGTPPQRLGLILSTNSNDTYVPSRYECTQFKRYKLPSETYCEKVLGGVFNPENSTTYTRLQSLDVPDFLDNPFRGANGSLSTDILTLQMEDQNLTLSNFQFGLIDEATQYANMIGLVCPFPFPFPFSQPQTPPPRSVIELSGSEWAWELILTASRVLARSYSKHSSRRAISRRNPTRST